MRVKCRFCQNDKSRDSGGGRVGVGMGAAVPLHPQLQGLTRLVILVGLVDVMVHSSAIR